MIRKKKHKSDNNAMVANWEIEGDRDILENIRVKNFFLKIIFYAPGNNEEKIF